MRLAVFTWKPLAALVAAVVLWAAPAEAAPKVAVIDMLKAMKAHPRTKVVETGFKKAQDDAIDNARRTEEDLKTLKRELDGMNVSDPEYLKKQKIYQQQVANANFNHEWAMKLAMREYTLGLERIYGAVRGEISRYAKANDIEVVLYKADPLTPLNSGDANDFAVKSRLRVVLYGSQEADITEAVIAGFKDK